MLSKSYRSLVLCIFYHEVAFKNYSRPPELCVFICTVYRCDKKDSTWQINDITQFDVSYTSTM